MGDHLSWAITVSPNCVFTMIEKTHLDDVQAQRTITIDIGMKDLARKSDFRWFCWVLFRELHGQAEDASLPNTLFWSKYRGLSSQPLGFTESLASHTNKLSSRTGAALAPWTLLVIGIVFYTRTSGGSSMIVL